jgi:Ca2+-transporting ATPase
MDTFAALALATDPATRKSLDRPPERKNAPLINVDMIKMIVIQAIYQVILCLVLSYVATIFLTSPTRPATTPACAPSSSTASSSVRFST